MRGPAAVNELAAMAGQQFFHRDNHVPSWFVRFVDSNVLFTGISTIAVVVLMIVLRLIARRADGLRWTDFDFGLPLVVGAIVALPAATTLRVAKEVYARSGTRPRSTLEISAVIVVALVMMAVVLARAAGARRPVLPGETPAGDDLTFGLFVPNLAGIFAVMLVLLFAARGGSLYG